MLNFNKHRLIRSLHIYTSMLTLLIMLFFTLTGLTLNHREWLPEAGESQLLELELPAALANPNSWEADPVAQGEQVRHWLRESQGLQGNQVRYNWDADENLLVIDVKRPGGYSLVEVDAAAAQVVLEQRHFGWLSTLNDLHMGRYSSELWKAFIDFSAILMLLFTLTGFWLVLPQKNKRRKLFAMAGLGSAIMLVCYALML